MERAVVTFIDILGFKNLVENRSENEMREILSLFHRLNNESPFSRDIHKDSTLLKELARTIKIIFFSDSVVRIRYAPDYEKSNICDGLYMCILEKELLILAEIQSDLLKKGILIRGGITIGDIFYDNETYQLFGKAMTRAYELESKIANYPRIIIDPTFSNVYARSIDFIESPIYIDSEMIFSVDCFNEREAKLLLADMKRYPNLKSEVIQRMQNSITSQKEMLEEHHKAIIELLLQSTQNMRINPCDPPSEHLFKLQDVKIFGKHAWLVNRFNAVIDSWEKVKIVAGNHTPLPNKINLRDFPWTDSHFKMDEHAFSTVPDIYEVEKS